MIELSLLENSEKTIIIHGILETIISLIVLTLLCIASYLFFSKHHDNPKEKKRFKGRLIYTWVVVAMIITAKIWVDGFTHIIAVLSLVSAALVVTNKELVMNLVGGLIIKWRSVFTEGDHIQLQSYSGTVGELGILYFRLFESSPNVMNRSSGKMIKIPNGLVISNPILNFSRQSNFIEFNQRWLISSTSDAATAKELLIDAANAVLQPHYQKNHPESIGSLEERNKTLSKLINFQPNIYMDLRWEKPTGLMFYVSYYCYPKDQDKLDWAIKESVLTAVKQQSAVSLVDTT